MPFLDREGNAPPLQGCPVLPGRGRARPLVHPHRLASPPSSPEAEALMKSGASMSSSPVFLSKLHYSTIHSQIVDCLWIDDDPHRPLHLHSEKEKKSELEEERERFV
jgi:hypothetical protein